jgi:hypothetical protein
MNQLFDLESQLRTSARKLFESVTAQNVEGLIIERDIERARTMTSAELAAHTEVLATFASQVFGCEAEVADARRAVTEYRRLGVVNEEDFEKVKRFWWMAHRQPVQAAA